jgi:hypothetical protein
MVLSPQSIRKGIIITFDSKPVEKNIIIEFSKTWKDHQIVLFKKLLKQGGRMKVNDVIIQVTPQEQIKTSRGEKDGGIITIPDPDARF